MNYGSRVYKPGQQRCPVSIAKAQDNEELIHINAELMAPLGVNEKGRFVCQ